MNSILQLIAAPPVSAALLILSRAAGCAAMAAPPLGGALPAPVRVAAVLALSLAAWPSGELSSVSLPLPMGLASEFCLGLLMALPLRMVLEGLRHGGEVFARMTVSASSSAASLLDGAKGGSVAGHVALLAGIAVLLTSGADRLAVLGFRESFVFVKPGAPIAAGRFLETARVCGAEEGRIAVLALLPLLATWLALEAALAIAGRASGLDISTQSVGSARALLMLALLSVAPCIAFGPAATSAVDAVQAGGGNR